MNKTNIPWVEKYRPDKLSDIVLDDNNKLIITNIIEQNYFPNMLFHGPPGTGKTTTIINLIKTFLLKHYGFFNSSLFIHLNASDDRGIDIVRNQISNFINTTHLFYKSLKFVILDEADYMTKSAQLYLKELIQHSTNTRFCLICNYTSKIDKSLHNEFVSICFNKVPNEYISTFLSTILLKENIVISKKKIESIRTFYDPDIRSMVNFLQLNFKTKNINFKILDDKIFKNLFKIFISSKHNEHGHILFLKELKLIIQKYNSNHKTIIKIFIKYLLNINSHLLNNSLFIDFIENIVHEDDISDKIIEYFYIRLFEFF